jgi:hypothetical protein
LATLNKLHLQDLPVAIFDAYPSFSVNQPEANDFFFTLISGAA